MNAGDLAAMITAAAARNGLNLKEVFQAAGVTAPNKAVQEQGCEQTPPAKRLINSPTSSAGPAAHADDLLSDVDDTDVDAEDEQEHGEEETPRVTDAIEVLGAEPGATGSGNMTAEPFISMDDSQVDEDDVWGTLTNDEVAAARAAVEEAAQDQRAKQEEAKEEEAEEEGAEEEGAEEGEAEEEEAEEAGAEKEAKEAAGPCEETTSKPSKVKGKHGKKAKGKHGKKAKGKHGKKAKGTQGKDAKGAAGNIQDNDAPAASKHLSEAALEALRIAKLAAEGKANSTNCKKEYDQFSARCKTKKFLEELKEKYASDKNGLFNMWLECGKDLSQIVC